MNKTLKIRTIALAATAALVLPSAALASSSQEGYGGPNDVVVGVETPPPSNPTPPAPTSVPAPAEATEPAVNDVADRTAESPAPVAATEPAAAETSSLPFTGADLGVLAVIGALMLAFGFGLRRLTHSPSQP